MHLLGTVVVEHLDVVAQLSASHNRVVAEEQAFAVEHRAVGDEFHFCHERAH